MVRIAYCPAPLFQFFYVALSDNFLIEDFLSFRVILPLFKWKKHGCGLFV